MVHRYGLISDTHGALHPEVFPRFEGVEAILHAGDVCSDSIIGELAAIAPVHAVAGNCDQVSAELPLRRTVELPFGLAGIAHGHLHAAKVDERVKQLAEAFKAPRLRLVLTGHSHVALKQPVGGVLVVNPGAACPPRMGTWPSVALLLWDDAADSIEVEFYQLNWSNVPRPRRW
ncbi:MAG: metallophosphoesterase family protein [Candidatus Sumerlaeia bacterium]|nr:metallophosphoesterase family protein [Candidatus Sumerlaeia bacterium]